MFETPRKSRRLDRGDMASSSKKPVRQVARSQEDREALQELVSDVLPVTDTNIFNIPPLFRKLPRGPQWPRPRGKLP